MKMHRVSYYCNGFTINSCIKITDLILIILINTNKSDDDIRKLYYYVVNDILDLQQNKGGSI